MLIGLLEDKCNRLVFPWCKGVGYDYSIVKESTQLGSYKRYYGKNFTNATDTHTGTNNSVISFWNEFLRNHSSCAVEIRKMICSDLFPPCFPNEGLAFYTICQSTCRSIENKCANIGASSPFGKYLTYCEAVASGNSSHGYCKHTSWPKPLHWINFFRGESPDNFFWNPPIFISHLRRGCKPAHTIFRKTVKISKVVVIDHL